MEDDNLQENYAQYRDNFTNFENHEIIDREITDILNQDQQGKKQNNPDFLLENYNKQNVPYNINSLTISQLNTINSENNMPPINSVKPINSTNFPQLGEGGVDINTLGKQDQTLLLQQIENQLVENNFNENVYQNQLQPYIPSPMIKFSGKDDIIKKTDIVSEQLLQGQITDVLKDIIQILECENVGEDGLTNTPKHRQQMFMEGYATQIMPYNEGIPKNYRQSHQLNQQLKMEKKGIRVNFNAIKEYLSMVLIFIKGNSLDEVIEKLNIPYGLTPDEKLAVFHEGVDENAGCLSSARACQRAILSFDLYIKQEEDLTLSNEYEDKFKQELEHIHNKMLFDSFNEALDSFRPYGLKGSPFNWRANAGRQHPIIWTKDNINNSLEKAQDRVLDWAMFMCGFIPDQSWLYNSASQFIF